MKVDYLFSRNAKIGSHIIAWAASFEPITNLDKGIPSHAAVLLDNTWVFESTLGTGVRIAPYSEWLKLNELLYCIPCTEKRHSEDVLRTATLLWNSSYDWGGIAFMGWRYLGLILLGKSLPSVNRWQNPNKHFCTEFMALLTGNNYSMSSPAKVCSHLLEATRN